MRIIMFYVPETVKQWSYNFEKNFKIKYKDKLTWNISVSESSLYSTITAWFRDNVYDIECCVVSKIAFDVWGDWTI